MKCAPACSFAVGRSRFKLYFLCTSWVLGVVICTVWWSLAVASTWRSVVVLAAVVFSLGAAVWGASQSTQGLLRWDGKAWWFEPAKGAISLEAARQCTPTVHFDFQVFMLLSLQIDDAKRTWLWAERAGAHKTWHGLRCALYAAAPLPGDVAEPKIARAVRRLSH